MELGSEFHSFSELVEAVRSYEETNWVKYYRRSSRSIEAYQKRLHKTEKHIESELKFAEIDYVCIYRGKNSKSKGTSKKPGHRPFHQRCPSQIKIRVSKDGTKLVVRELREEHNHHVSQAAYNHLSRQRRYTEFKEEDTEVKEEVLRLKANEELILEHVLQSAGKIVTLKDLHTAAAVKKLQHSESNFVTLFEEMKKEPGGTTEVDVYDDSELQDIFYQDAWGRDSFPAKKLKTGEARRNKERRRHKTRINIGVAFPRWRSLMKLKGFQSDAQVACYLLDSYERALVESTSRRGKLQAPAVCCRNDGADDDEETDNSSDEDYDPPDCIGTSEELEKSPSVYRPECEYAAEIIQVTVGNEEVPLEQQEWNSSLGKENPEPPHIQPEQEREQLQVKMLNALAKHQPTVEDTFTPKVHLGITDVQQQSVDKEHLEQHEWDPGVEDKGPEPPHFKDEQEGQWIIQEGEQLQGQDEAEILEIPFTTVQLMFDHEDERQSSQCHQKQTDEDRVDCGSKPDGSLDSDTHLRTDTGDRSKHCNEDHTTSTEPAS